MHIASLCLNTLVVWILSKFFNKNRELKLLTRISKLAALYLPFVAILYVLTPSYFSYIEVHLANITGHWLNRFPIYTDIASKERYSILYGPWPILASAVFMAPGFLTIQASKVVGLVNLSLFLYVFWKMLSQLSKSFDEKLFIFGFVGLVFLGFDNYSYVNRPDSFLITYSFLGLYFLTQKKINQLSYLSAALLLGLSIASKIHGFVYFVPIFIYFIELNPQFYKFRTLIFIGFLGLALSFIPFLLPGVSFLNFYNWLKMTSKHGLSFKLFTDNLTYGLPYFVLLYLSGFQNRFKLTFITLFLSFLLASIFGSLVGAGTHHLLPILPLIIFFSAKSYFQLQETRKRNVRVFLGIFLVALTYDAFISQKAILKYFLTIPDQISQFQDLKEIREPLPGPTEIGYGENSQLEMSYFKPFFVRSGDPLLLESDALMDMGASGLEIPEETYAHLKTCKTPFFILPTTPRPWNMTSGFGFELFNKSWRDDFFRYYEAVGHSKFYTAYGCKGR